MEINNDTIKLDNGKSLNIGLKVMEAIELNDFVIVLTDPMEKLKLNNENVFGYDLNGKLLWQIENLNLFHKSPNYTSIYIRASDFYLYNRCGIEVKIDPSTGTVLSKELIK